jgi:hypothetical protein
MITIYGASDDLVEVGGCEGADVKSLARDMQDVLHYAIAAGTPAASLTSEYVCLRCTLREGEVRSHGCEDVACTCCFGDADCCANQPFADIDGPKQCACRAGHACGCAGCDCYGPVLRPEETAPGGTRIDVEASNA